MASGSSKGFSSKIPVVFHVTRPRGGWLCYRHPHEVLNGEQHLSSTEYLRATVELLPADESQTVDVHALQRCLVSDGVCITYDII